MQSEFELQGLELRDSYLIRGEDDSRVSELECSCAPILTTHKNLCLYAVGRLINISISSSLFSLFTTAYVSSEPFSNYAQVPVASAGFLLMLGGKLVLRLRVDNSYRSVKIT